MGSYTIPYHTCDTINQASVECFLQRGQGRGKHVLVIGESLALDGWVLSGKAFYTVAGTLVATGKRFNALFAELGFGIEDVCFTNMCKCVLGKDRALLKSCVPKCAGHVLRQIEYCKPRLIIILGKYTLEMFEKIYGVKVTFGEIESVAMGGKKYQIFSLYHPSPIHPKSMEWNRELIIKIRDAICGLM